MRRRAFAVIWMFGLLAVAGAGESDFRLSPRRVRDEVRAVVTAQLSALARGDFVAAYGYAAEGIKREFDARLFGQMIKRGYPLLVRHESADVGIVRDNGAGAAQVLVTVIDHSNRATAWRYWLVKEKAAWKISGVVMEPKPPRGDI
jgi:hypothetical protein